jgi:hypothetical protein
MLRPTLSWRSVDIGIHPMHSNRLLQLYQAVQFEACPYSQSALTTLLCKSHAILHHRFSRHIFSISLAGCLGDSPGVASRPPHVPPAAFIHLKSQCTPHGSLPHASSSSTYVRYSSKSNICTVHRSVSLRSTGEHPIYLPALLLRQRLIAPSPAS